MRAPGLAPTEAPALVFKTTVSTVILRADLPYVSQMDAMVKRLLWGGQQL